MTKELLAIGVGGAAGSIARYLCISASAKLLSTNYTHYGTLFVNSVGSFFVTFFMVLYIEKFELDPIIRMAVVVGFLGGFTTFSAFSYESVSMLQSGEYGKATGYILATNLLGVLFALVGAYIAKRFFL